jgi:hypothetical protein
MKLDIHYTKTGWYLILVLVLIGCSHTVKIQEYSISRSLTLFGENSEIRLSATTSLSNYKDNLVFYDIKTSKIIVCDYLGNHIVRYGNKGKGPNEIMEIGSLSVKEDTVFYFDNGNKRIGILNLANNNIKTICAYPKGFYSDNSRFDASRDGNFYISNLYYEKPILVLDKNFNIVNKFGKKNNPTNQFISTSNSFFHIMEKSEYIFAADVQSPLVNVYKKNGTLISNHDFSNLELFSGRINEIKQKRKTVDNPSARHFVFIQDAQISGDYIYLLVIQNYKGKMYANKILKGEIVDGEIKELALIKLINNDNLPHYYSSFCIIKDHIYAFDLMTSEIHVFDLEDKKGYNLPNFNNLHYENSQNYKN